MIDIYYRDLTPDAQKKVLEFYGYKSEAEGNFEHVPLFILARPWEKDWQTAGEILDKLRQSRAKY
jgi:hypothetical protein